MKRMLLAVTMTACLAVETSAHHSFAAFYFEEQSVSITGEVLQFDYTAPHAWVHVTAPDEAGVARRYSAEWANPSRLARDGITKETLRAGDRVTITGSPGRKTSEYRVHLKGIERPADGWSWRGRRRR
jgi:hypothetical protein